MAVQTEILDDEAREVYGSHNMESGRKEPATISINEANWSWDLESDKK